MRLVFELDHTKRRIYCIFSAARSKRLIESYLHKGPDRPIPLHNLPYFVLNADSNFRLFSWDYEIK